MDDKLIFGFAQKLIDNRIHYAFAF